MTTDTGRPFIVTGVDGSPCSQDALEWAARQAELTGAELRAVMVWHLPEIYAYTPRDLAADARKALDQAVEKALGPQRGATVTKQVIEGRPAAALIEMSRGAELLVAGSHGHGGFDGMALGSVSHHCAQHAHCPVLVIRHTARRAHA